LTRATLAAPARFLLEVKKSRFLAQAAAAATPDAALAFLDAVRDPAATHNCWAYRMGQQYRFSDDGEPGGTAGRPILAALDGSGLDQLMVVVTRWYGGIKLGAGGLVRAYGGAAAECLRTATRVALIEQRECRIDCAFDLAGALHSLLAGHDATKLGEDYHATGLSMRLSLPVDRLPALRVALRDISRGQAQLHEMDDR